MPKRSRNSQYESQTAAAERTDRLELNGKVEECLPGTLFKVRCDNGHVVLCTLSGKLRQNRIRIIAGDGVQIHVSPYDVSRGRIVWRGSK